MRFFFTALLLYGAVVKGQQPQLILPIGHTEDIFLTQYACNSKYLITCAYDNNAKLWDVYTGKLLHTFADLLHTPEHIANVRNTTSLSPDGKYLTALTVDGILKKWQLPSAKLIFSKKMGKSIIAGIEYSADGKYILIKRRGLKYEIDEELIRASDGRLLYTIDKTKLNHEAEKSIEFSPDGKYILIRTDSSMYLFQSANGLLIRKIEQFKDFAYPFFSPDGKYLAIMQRRSNQLRLWRLNDGNLHQISISGRLEFSPDSKYILSTGRGKLTLTNVENGEIVKRFDEDISPGMQGNFSKDGKYIFLTRSDQFIRGTDPYDSVTYVWETKSQRLLYKLQGQGWDMRPVKFSPDNKYIATVSLNTQLWERETGELIQSFNGREFVFSPDKKTIAITHNRTVQVFNMRLKDIQATLKAENNLIRAIFSPDGGKLITLSNEKNAKLWDINTGKNLKTFKEESSIIDADFSHDGESILFKTVDGKVTVKNIISGKLNEAIENEG